ncbi:MAG: hypothetical protein QGG05_06200, partial [Candidatus Latescibacteria bacterium]|nr:hypothetical protein [Candidatus Latescibacterota bacterium]
LVELNNKEVAVVYEPNPDNVHKPTLAIVTTSNGRPRPNPFIVNLAKRSEAEGREVAKVVDPETAGVDTEEIIEAAKTRGERTERLRR